MISRGHCKDAKALQAFIKSRRLECHPARMTSSNGYFFLQQCEGPFTVGYALQVLKDIVIDMSMQLSKAKIARPEPILAQIDMTRDLRGTFFIIDDWPNKAAVMKTMMEQAFDTKLKLWRNSFSSCLQFEEP